MATAVNRTTLEILYSVNYPDYDPAIWIIDPDLTILETVPIKYIKLVGDVLTEMTVAEKAAVDAAELAAAKEFYISKVCWVREWKIDTGNFEYPSGSGKYLPSSTEDQARWIGWDSIGGRWSSLGMSYPFRVYSKDGTTYTDITKAGDFGDVVEALWIHITAKFVEASGIVQTIKNASTLQAVSDATTTYFEDVDWSSLRS
jgi:hypothetical protein